MEMELCAGTNTKIGAEEQAPMGLIVVAPVKARVLLNLLSLARDHLGLHPRSCPLP